MGSSQPREVIKTTPELEELCNNMTGMEIALCI